MTTIRTCTGCNATLEEYEADRCDSCHGRHMRLVAARAQLGAATVPPQPPKPTRARTPKPATETGIMLSVRDALLRTGKVRLWRNNSGRLCDARGRWVTFGLGLGSPDLVGFVVGSGRFFALEVKTETGRVRTEQTAWHRAAREAGALVAFVRSVEEALAVLDLATVDATADTLPAPHA